MAESVIEIIKLENGDIVLRQAEHPDKNLVTISFSEPVQDLLQGLQLQIGQSMIQAGMDAFRTIQHEQLKAAESAATRGRLH